MTRRAFGTLAAGALLAALLAGCGTEQRAIGPLPGPGAHQARHPKIVPDLPPMPAAGSGRGGYYQDDGPGDDPPPNLMEVPDAVVKAEPYARLANRPYTVLGKTYTPLLNEEPFDQRGVASWYGKKFHGQRTSSGELYDMYKMTAAHPTLPIPSYARITNVESGQQVVVRINDRGPFHSDRIIDVSFTAALKLGLLGKGSHEVLVERVLPDQPEPLAAARRNAPVAENAPVLGGFPVDLPPAQGEAPGPAQPPVATTAAVTATVAPARVAGSFYLQLGAFSRAEKADELRTELLRSGALLGAIDVVEGGTLHRVFCGPFETRMMAAQAAREVPEALKIKPIVVRR